MGTTDSAKHGHVLVSGSSSGIGAATVQSLLDLGFSVTGVSRTILTTNADAYQHLGIDLGNLDQLEQRAAEIRKLGPLTAAVLCHGVGDFGGLEQFSTARIRRLIDTNLTSVIMLSRLLLPLLKQNDVSTLVLMGSEAALRGGQKGAVYAASKFGLRGLAQSLREECSSSGVRVSIVNPGMVRTPFFDNLSFEPGEHADNALLAEDVATAVINVISSPRHMVTEEINLSPIRKVVRHRR